MAEQWVHIKHPETGGRSLVPETTFYSNHIKKGWELIPNSELEAESETREKRDRSKPRGGAKKTNPAPRKKAKNE